MREQLEKRLQELRSEFEKGQATLKELDAQANATRSTLLRISGAIQVLEEELEAYRNEQRQGHAPSAEGKALREEPDAFELQAAAKDNGGSLVREPV